MWKDFDKAEGIKPLNFKESSLPVEIALPTPLELATPFSANVACPTPVKVVPPLSLITASPPIPFERIDSVLPKEIVMALLEAVAR